MEDFPISINDRICGELEEKNRVLNEYVKDREQLNDREGVIQVRIHQLALCKVLVNVHGRNSFLLVQGHTNIGECYLNYEYYEQALEHLITALKMNGSLFSSFEDAKSFHPHILTLLGKCYLEAGSVDEAIGLLDKAINMSHSVFGEEHIANSQILNTLSQAYIKKKDYQKAMQYLTTLWEIHESNFGMKHDSIPKIYLDMAKVYNLQKDAANAVDLQKRAINLLIELDIQPDVAAEASVTLGQWLQNANNYSEALEALRNAEHLYEFNNGLVDKRTAKVKRSICMLMLKAGEYDQALEECMELEDVEKQLFGEGSIQYAKNLKVIGTILMILSRHQEAREYYNRALVIFQGNKNGKRGAVEIRQKLATISEALKDEANL